jgi:hypothetical protein
MAPKPSRGAQLQRRATAPTAAPAAQPPIAGAEAAEIAVRRTATEKRAASEPFKWACGSCGKQEDRSCSHYCKYCAKALHAHIPCQLVYMPNKGDYACSAACIRKWNATCADREHLPVRHRPEEASEEEEGSGSTEVGGAGGGARRPKRRRRWQRSQQLRRRRRRAVAAWRPRRVRVRQLRLRRLRLRLRRRRRR